MKPVLRQPLVGTKLLNETQKRDLSWVRVSLGSLTKLRSMFRVRLEGDVRQGINSEKSENHQNSDNFFN